MGDDIFGRLSLYRRGWLSAGTRRWLHRLGKLADDRRQSAQDDLKVQSKGNVARVKDIHLDHLAERCPVLAIDLPQSGEAWEGVCTRALFRCITVKFTTRARSRSDQTHFSLQHIEDLWQLIETSHSQKLPAKDETWISS